MRPRSSLRAALAATVATLSLAAAGPAAASAAPGAAGASRWAGSRPLPAHVFSPYFETYDTTDGGLAALSQASGARYLTMAFIQTAQQGFVHGRTGTATPAKPIVVVHLRFLVDLDDPGPAAAT